MATRKKPASKKKTARKATTKKVAAKTAGSSRKKTAPDVEKGGGRNGVAKLVLDENLTISSAHDLKERLLKSAKGKNRIELDGGKVELVDTAGLQVLVAFILYCKKNSLEVQWMAKSQALEQTSDLLGLSSVLES